MDSTDLESKLQANRVLLGLDRPDYSNKNICEKQASLLLSQYGGCGTWRSKDWRCV